MRCSVCPSAVVGDTDEGVKPSGKVFPVFRVFGQMNRTGKLRVCYARDVWRTNGLRIWIRLVVLSNFHVQSIFIRVTD